MIYKGTLPAGDFTSTSLVIHLLWVKLDANARTSTKQPSLK